MTKFQTYLSTGKFGPFYDWLVLGKRFRQYEGDESGTMSFDDLELAVNDYHQARREAPCR